MLQDFTLTAWAVAAFAVLLTGISKAGFGSALGGIAVPLLSLFIPPASAAAVMLPILILMDAFGIRAYWGKWSISDLKIMLPGAVVGVVIGSFVFGALSQQGIKGFIGTIAVLFALDRFFKLRDRLRMNHVPGKVAGTVWGAVSGLTSTIAHAGGPPILVYLLGRSLTKESFVATTVVYFACVNVVKLPPYIALGLFTRDVLLMALMLAPLVPFGVWIGLRVQRYVPERPFFLAATTLLGLSGIKLLFDAFG